MQISRVVPQLRTTDLAASIDFYTSKLGFTLELQFADFYADVRRGDYVVHLKPIDAHGAASQGAKDILRALATCEGQPPAAVLGVHL